MTPITHPIVGVTEHVAYPKGIIKLPIKEGTQRGRPLINY